MNLSTPESYYSTELGSFGSQKEQIDGIWNITHTSVMDPYHTKGVSWDYMGLTYTQCRDVIKVFMTDTQWDWQLIEAVKQMVIKDIPIRSGKLADIVFKTMRIERFIWYSVHYFTSLRYTYPIDRPLPVDGRVQHAGEYGYGEWGTYRPTEPLVVARVDPHPHVTPTGLNALYKLNDPTAIHDIRESINDAFDKIIINEYADRWNIVIEVIV